LKTIDIAALALNAALYAVLGIFFFFVVPLAFGPVRFWPQVVIPAVFAVVFGPWVGGLGAALGIFASDMVIHGNPLLSLMAGVTSNFVMFWLIGYISKKRIRWLPSIIIYGVGTGLLAVIAYIYTEIIYVGLIIGSYFIFLFFALMTQKRVPPAWQRYNVASVVGLLIGSAIIGLMVPVYFQFFIPDAIPLSLGAGLVYFIWTFTTEIPFLLVLGPPIVAAVYAAFPILKRKATQRENQ
jgi:hypothetical protein